MGNQSNEKIAGSVSSQQPEANAFVTIQCARIRTQVMEEHNGTHNTRKHEQVENHSWASMSETEIVTIYKTKKRQLTISKRGPPLGMYLMKTASSPLEARTSKKKFVKTKNVRRQLRKKGSSLGTY